MSTKLTIHPVKDWRPVNPQSRSLLAASAHYRKSDLPLFAAGYNELCRIDLSGRRVLEICCGRGELSAAIARAWPQAEVFALDRYPDAGGAVRAARETAGLHNAHYLCGDALHLAELDPASFDVVVGQAALHHLAHDTTAVGREFSRVLKPDGRLIFINEPLGHNVLVAMVRAFQVSRARIGDESNLFVGLIEEVAMDFAGCEVKAFNLLGYPLKLVHRLAPASSVALVHRLDTVLMNQWPRLAQFGGNANIIFRR